jgi:uracil-DNA glycosylase
MGNSAIRALINPSDSDSVTTLHGMPLEVESVTYLPMYHPAAALYTASLRKVMEEDFRKLRGILDSLIE